MGLDIPMLLATYNELRFSPSVTVSMRLEALPEDKLPSACVKCGKCAAVCPQKINIPLMMEELNTALSKLPKWSDICRQREETQNK